MRSQRVSALNVRRAVAAVLAVVATTTVLYLGAPAADAQVRSSTMRLGVTHTRFSADSWNDPEAVARARSLLRAAPVFQNQHLMGWGTESPEPSPGAYDFSTLDARMELIRATGGTPVITLCCAPDWMKGGVAGRTDWTRLEVAPRAEHFAAFAELSRRTALRYPDVRHFQVWNELKGFWDPARNRWDVEAYTRLYNQVYEALKSVDPTIQVGGPYVPMDSWADASTMSHPSAIRGAWGVLDQRAMDAVDYWLANKRGADFVTVDGWTTTKDEGLVTDEFTATQKMAAVTTWLRSRTTLPIWWAELYPIPERAQWAPAHQAEVFAVALEQLRGAGASVVLLWEPQADGDRCAGCLWSDTRRRGGGMPTPLWTTVSRLVGPRRQLPVAWAATRWPW